MQGPLSPPTLQGCHLLSSGTRALARLLPGEIWGALSRLSGMPVSKRSSLTPEGPRPPVPSLNTNQMVGAERYLSLEA